MPAEFSRPQNDLSLIDFDDSQPATNPTGTTASQIDELASLFGPSPSSTAAPAVPQSSLPPFLQAQGSSTASSQPTTPFGDGYRPSVNNANRPGAGVISLQYTSGSPAGTPPPGSIRLPGTPQVQVFPQQGNAGRVGSPGSFFAANHTSPAFSSNGSMGIPVQQPMQAQPATQPPNNNATTQSQGKDPFADLVDLF